MSTLPAPVPATGRGPWRTAPVLGRGLLVGMLEGAALGAATALVLVANGASISTGQTLTAGVVYGGFGGMVGGVVGAACALAAIATVLVLHAVRPIGIGGARVLGAFGAAAPAALLCPWSPAAAALAAGASAVCAAVPMRWIVGVPRGSATMGP